MLGESEVFCIKFPLGLRTSKVPCVCCCFSVPQLLQRCMTLLNKWLQSSYHMAGATSLTGKTGFIRNIAGVFLCKVCTQIYPQNCWLNIFSQKDRLQMPAESMRKYGKKKNTVNVQKECKYLTFQLLFLECLLNTGIEREALSSSVVFFEVVTSVDDISVGGVIPTEVHPG